MLKNMTPRQLALRSAAVIAGGIVGTVLLLETLRGVLPTVLLLLLLVATAFGIAYLVLLRGLDHYIYRKIKLIYKTIHRQKVNTEIKQSGVDLDTDVIDEVEKEVEEWADSRQQEIEQFERFAEYRRRYVGDISHELKTPIFNIQGYLHTLMEGGYDDRTISMKFLQKASKNVDRLQTIVEDLGAISRLESGELILDHDDFYLSELVQEVFDDMEMKAQEAGVALGFKPGAEGHFAVRADRESIRQVLLNLVTNSIKYGNPGGFTRVGFYDMESYILCEVADNGIGIPEKHLPHVFDRFYRVDKSRSRQKGGSGLGLAIVKHIMEAHSQTINVRSTPGLGSTFGITLAKAR